KSKRSLPKNISSPTNIVGDPNTPRSAAAAVLSVSLAPYWGDAARCRSRSPSSFAPASTSISFGRWPRSTASPQTARKNRSDIIGALAFIQCHQRASPQFREVDPLPSRIRGERHLVALSPALQIGHDVDALVLILDRGRPVADLLHQLDQRE